MGKDTEERATLGGKRELSDTVELAVGVGETGSRFKRVLVEETCGIDDHLLTSKKTGGNSGKGISLVLSRCIQAIPGYAEQKSNPESLLDRELVRNMYQVDRDILITHIYFISGHETGIMAGVCPRCSTPMEEEVPLSELEMVPWPKDKPAQLEFAFKKGVWAKAEGESEARYHREGILRFPTGADQEAVAGIGDDSATAVDCMLAACITRLGGLDGIDTSQAQRLSSVDRREIMHLLKKGLPGLRQWKEVTCTCKRKFDITLDIAAFFDGQRK